MYLSKIQIENFRCIKSLDVALQDGLNTFVGKNNVGKSTILDAIRLTLGSTLNNPNPIWVTEEDFYKESETSNRSESFTIKMEFSDLSESQRVSFFEIIDFDLADETKSIARIVYTASWPLNKAKRVSVKRTGGQETPDMTEVPQKIMEMFSVVYLPALRDAEIALSPGNKSQLALLLKSLADDKDKEAEKNVKNIFEIANDSLAKEKFVNDIVNKINECTGAIVESDIPKSKVSTAKVDFLKILKTLQIQMDDNPVESLSANGLGINNLLYIAVILQYLDSVHNDECSILLIEEPEAHLHPQLVLSLSRYLSEILPANTKPQTFLTTHSPSLVTDIPIEKMHLLFRKAGRVCCNSMRNSSFEDAEKKQFKRLMDITRSTLYFAKGVILVEGVCEASLVPIFAERIGVDLRKKQISVIPICGVSFQIFEKIFKPDVLDIPMAIITDGDPKIEWPQSAGKDGEYVIIHDYKSAIPKKDDICARTENLKSLFNGVLNVRVCNSSVTLEYDLAIASEDNALLMTKAWELGYTKGLSKTLNEAIVTGKVSLEEKALTIWRVVCLSSVSAKGDLSSNLADLLEKKNDAGNYANKFDVPNYIMDAIKFVSDNIG